MVSIKEIAKRPKRLASGHRLCPGCGAGIVVNMVLSSVEKPVVISNATGCLEVSTTVYPYTSWNTPFIHTAFENAAATMSGVEGAYKSLKRRGRIEEEIYFAAFGGDGGTYDIGLQSLSGALERGHDFVYICYDNGAYMNTGVQRSSATPLGASTTTSPAGKKVAGKPHYKKDLTRIVVAHDIPYIAQASISHWKDLIEKSKKAFETKGPAFINVIAPCPTGWNYDPKDTVKLAKEAVYSCIWPLYEVEDGKYKLSFDPKKKRIDAAQWFRDQRRFKHLFEPGNEYLLAEIQDRINKKWDWLLEECGKAKDKA
jgi:pyruvate ferredoxin oxidoreductase beta subunit